MNDIEAVLHGKRDDDPKMYWYRVTRDGKTGEQHSYWAEDLLRYEKRPWWAFWRKLRTREPRGAEWIEGPSPAQKVLDCHHAHGRTSLSIEDIDDV